MARSMYNRQTCRVRMAARGPICQHALPHAFDLFLDALMGEDVPLISVKEAADRSAVMEAFYQAAATNSWVQPKTS